MSPPAPSSSSLILSLFSSNLSPLTMQRPFITRIAIRTYLCITYIDLTVTLRIETLANRQLQTTYFMVDVPPLRSAPCCSTSSQRFQRENYSDSRTYCSWRSCLGKYWYRLERLSPLWTSPWWSLLFRLTCVFMIFSQGGVVSRRNSGAAARLNMEGTRFTS
jgi:hypothetical protein